MAFECSPAAREHARRTVWRRVGEQTSRKILSIVTEPKIQFVFFFFINGSLLTGTPRQGSPVVLREWGLFLQENTPSASVNLQSLEVMWRRKMEEVRKRRKGEKKQKKKRPPMSVWAFCVHGRINRAAGVTDPNNLVHYCRRFLMPPKVPIFPKSRLGPSCLLRVCDPRRAPAEPRWGRAPGVTENRGHGNDTMRLHIKHNSPRTSTTFTGGGKGS